MSAILEIFGGGPSFLSIETALSPAVRWKWFGMGATIWCIIHIVALRLWSLAGVETVADTSEENVNRCVVTQALRTIRSSALLPRAAFSPPLPLSLSLSLFTYPFLSHLIISGDDKDKKGGHDSLHGLAISTTSFCHALVVVPFTAYLLFSESIEATYGWRSGACAHVPIASRVILLSGGFAAYELLHVVILPRSDKLLWIVHAGVMIGSTLVSSSMPVHQNLMCFLLTYEASTIFLSAKNMAAKLGWNSAILSQMRIAFAVTFVVSRLVIGVPRLYRHFAVIVSEELIPGVYDEVQKCRPQWLVWCVKECVHMRINNWILL